MTIAEQLRQQGIELGKELGIEQGKLVVARKMLTAGLNIEDVANFTQLSLEKIKQINNKAHCS